MIIKETYFYVAIAYSLSFMLSGVERSLIPACSYVGVNQGVLLPLVFHSAQALLWLVREVIMSVMWAVGFMAWRTFKPWPPLLYLVSLSTFLTPFFSGSICKNSHTQMAIATAEPQLPQLPKEWSSLKRNARRRDSPPSISDPDSTFLTSPLLSVKGSSSAVTNIAFSSPHFDKWLFFFSYETKLLSSHHKAVATKDDYCI